MKIALVGYPLLGERTWLLCSEFEQQNIDTHVLVPRSWPKIPTEDEPTTDVSFEVHRHDSVFNGRIGLYTLRGLGSTISRINPDAVITHGEPWQVLTASVEVACRRHDIPHVVFSWENLVRVPLSRLQRLAERAVLPRLDGVIAGSDAAESRLRARGFDGPTTIAPQTGIDTEMFSPDISIASLRSQFGLNANSEVVLYAGRLAPEKGIGTLLDAVPSVLESTSNVEFLILGSGPLESSIARRIENDPAGERIKLVSENQPFSRMPAIYNLASIFCYPSVTVESWAEQFGYAVVEAMACGIPVVTTECGALPYVVGDGGTVCPERDHDSLGAALVDLLTATDRRSRLGRVARRRVEQRFSLSKVAETQLSFVRSLSVDSG